jgi:hypothetical protein
MDLKETVWRCELVQMAQDGVLYWAVINIVMNFQVPWKGGELSDYEIHKDHVKLTV